MGVYIRGMEMPKNCNVCNFHMLRFCCAADKDLTEKDTRPLIECRPESCPLVPIPPHVRLIDIKALKLAIANNKPDCLIGFLDELINNADKDGES